MIEPANTDLFDPGSLVFIEGLLEDYLENPESVPESWRNYFDQQGVATGYISPHRMEEDLVRNARRTRKTNGQLREPLAQHDAIISHHQSGVDKLINAYRLMGHMAARVYPIDFMDRPEIPELDPETYGLSKEELTKVFDTGDLHGAPNRTFSEIMDQLRRTYTGTVGVEYLHIGDTEEKKWVQEYIESSQCRLNLDDERRRGLHRRLTAAEGMERFLHVRFSGQKRFSLEGGESLIPLLDQVIERSGTISAREIVLGMAHRGRLNVLVNVMGKRPRDLVSEFEGTKDIADDQYTGDVKYHQGFSCDVQTPGGTVHLALAFNPSHLEIINPVVEGSARARQDRRSDAARNQVVPVLIHGDAAVAGQGVVAETLCMSGTRGYGTGGTVHVVVNNQIGFTTSNPRDARSTLYCTDVGKVVQAPILHVNGDDPEAVLFAATFAADFRMRFRKDVFIDLICYRRHGHNEGDEPSATQPLMYQKIRKHPTTLELYSERLKREGVLDNKAVKAAAREYRDALEEGDRVSLNMATDKDYTYLANWNPYLAGHWDDPVDTAVTTRMLKKMGRLATEVPEDITLHPGVERIVDDRRAMVEGKQPLDWGCAETLAYATLLKEGYSVRFSGQDAGRGTFFHRHAVLHDQVTGRRWQPLRHLHDNQPRFQVIDSILSEEAVLGFEYGYSSTIPTCLVVWEAQYGDFANGAQVVVDQFISSSQQKWNLFSGLVMMLPHGWEGQGPEHSSARLERYLQLCAMNNMQVVVPSTAGQMFHLLRRQMLRKLRIPLIIMSPKSMLRRKQAFSTLKDLSESRFQTVIGERKQLDPNKVSRIVLCSGKVFYELEGKRDEVGLEDVAIIRIEQLYPFDEKRLLEAMAPYTNAGLVVWTQEEPRNQGAWYQIQHRIRGCLRPGQHLDYAGRVPCSAPAGGSFKRHMERERRLINDALGLDADGNPPVRKPAATTKAGKKKTAARKKAPADKKQAAKKSAAKKSPKTTTSKTTSKKSTTGTRKKKDSR